ncbi:MAG: phosphatidylserine decarboxylase family protein [Ignavibacteriales bacterium]|nr:phosphatidylserine decarboxylase family protein [Ignavibacteriales bacterium]MBK7979876.1 phosphatidylserine decarboxylase family protein [Ignavibacteriota bacterium]
MLTKYGYPTIGISAFISFLLILFSIFAETNIIRFPLFFLGLFILIFTLNFFRDPDRTTPKIENIVVSPADGKILLIKNVMEKRFLNEEATQISIFMSPLNVHVNRIPIDGKVDFLKYIKGEYLVAYHDKADERNERTEIGITSKFGKVLFTQVAGMVARRIVYELNIGDSVKAGERFGMIKFGSRVDVIVPKSWRILVNEGDITRAGETILFEIN